MQVQCCRHCGVDGVSARAWQLIMEHMLVGGEPHEHDMLCGIDTCELDVVHCHVSSTCMAGRDNCSMAMALGAVQQHEHDTHANKHKHVKELEHTCMIKCSILAEAVPHKHHGDNSLRGPHGGERGLQCKELNCGSDFWGDEAGMCEAYVNSDGEGGGEEAGHLGLRSRMCGCAACGHWQWGGWGCTAVM